MDRCLKPSLTSYDFRPNLNLGAQIKVISPLESAKTAGDALVELCNREVNIAENKLRFGETRGAMAVLRRAQAIASIARKQRGSIPHPAAQAALATVHLHSCAVLSRIGRHEQALDEARLGSVASEELFRIMLRVASEAEEAQRTGDHSKPIKPLAEVLFHPPPWLEQAVETMINLRQAIALELEILASEGNPVYQFRQRGVYSRSMTGGLSPKSPSSPPLSPSLSRSMGSVRSLPSLASPTLASEVGTAGLSRGDVDRLHDEARFLARELLPEGSEARKLAEHVHKQAASRRRDAIGDARLVGRGTISSSVISKSSVSSVSLPEMSLLGKPSRGRLPYVEVIATSNISEEDSASKSILKSYHSLDTAGQSTYCDDLRAKESVLDSAHSVASTTRIFTPGDVYYASTVQLAPPSPKPRKEKKYAPPRTPVVEEPKVDVFKEWSLLHDVGRSNLFEIYNRTHQGQSKILDGFAIESRRFKALELPSRSDDILYDNAHDFSGYGVLSRSRAEKHKAQYRDIMYDTARKEAEELARDKHMFGLYGVTIKDAVPDVKDLLALMRAAQEQNPIIKERMRLARLNAEKAMNEEKQRRLEEARLKQIESVQELAMDSDKIKRMRKGDDGNKIVGRKV